MSKIPNLGTVHDLSADKEVTDFDMKLAAIVQNIIMPNFASLNAGLDSVEQRLAVMEAKNEMKVTITLDPKSIKAIKGK